MATVRLQDFSVAATGSSALIFGETIPTSCVQAPIPEAHLLAVDASDHSTSSPEPFLDAVLITEELVILLGIARL